MELLPGPVPSPIPILNRNYNCLRNVKCPVKGKMKTNKYLGYVLVKNFEENKYCIYYHYPLSAGRC